MNLHRITYALNVPLKKVREEMVNPVLPNPNLILVELTFTAMSTATS
jgi:hypothetical protein